MDGHRMRLVAVLVVPCWMLALTVPRAQAPSAAAIDLSGTWSLDVHLTDHPEQIALAIQIDTGEIAPASFGRGAPGGEGEGRPHTPGGRRSGGAPAAPENRMSGGERKLLTELVRPVQFPPPVLTITHQGTTATTIRAGDRPADTLRTDGKSENYATEGGTAARTARWEGPQLHVAYDVGRAGTLTYTYFMIPATGQLLIRVNFERVPGQPGPFDIKLVYNRRSASPAAPR